MINGEEGQLLFFYISIFSTLFTGYLKVLVASLVTYFFETDSLSSLFLSLLSLLSFSAPLDML